MSRHVHFASANSFQSPPPPLSRSFTSSASSSGPLTPPQLAHAGPLGPAFMPGEFYVESPVAYGQAHSLIAFSTRPPLRYDVSLHPSMITTLSSRVSSAGFLEPAVYPPQAEITLATPHLPWQISVPASNKRFVTVADVLNTIYHSLRVNATPAEFEALRTDKLMRQVSAEYTKRCKRLRGYHGHKQEKREGIKRVDFLMGYHQFQGIAPKDGVPGVWHLTIS